MNRKDPHPSTFYHEHFLCVLHLARDRFVNVGRDNVTSRPVHIAQLLGKSPRSEKSDSITVIIMTNYDGEFSPFMHYAIDHAASES